MTERDPYMPLYLVIAADLRAKIKSGDLPADARLPSERELCEQYECSTITARHAVTSLRNEGLIYTIRGSGAFVSKRPTLVRVLPDRFRRQVHKDQATYRQEAERAGMELQVDHSTEQVEAPGEVAERLGIEEGDPVSETTYRISMEGEPVSISVAWEPLTLTGGTDIEFPHEGPHAGAGMIPRFDAIGIHIDTEEEFLRARMPEPHEQHQLKIPAGVPVVQIWQTFWAGDLAVETAKIIYRGDRYEFNYKTPID